MPTARCKTQEKNRAAVSREDVEHSVAQHLTWLAEELKRIKQAIAQTLDDDPDLRGKRDLLDSIPGLGERTIAVLLGYGAGQQPLHARGLLWITVST